MEVSLAFGSVGRGALTWGLRLPDPQTPALCQVGFSVRGRGLLLGLPPGEKGPRGQPGWKAEASLALEALGAPDPESLGRALLLFRGIPATAVAAQILQLALSSLLMTLLPPPCVEVLSTLQYVFTDSTNIYEH